MLTQRKRGGDIKGDVNYQQIAERVFRMTDARRHMKALGMPTPSGPGYVKHTIMGREFDPAQPEAYLKGFAIQKAG